MSDINNATGNVEGTVATTASTAAPTTESSTSAAQSTSTPTSTATPTTETTLSKPVSRRERLRSAIEAAEQEAAKKTEAATTTETKTPVATTTSTVATTAQVDPVTGKVLEPIKAPNTVPASLREKWKDLPRDYQQYLHDRELDLQQKLTQSMGARKLADELTSVVKPFEATLKSLNASTIDVVKDLLPLAKVLYTGTPQQKAHLFHQLVTRFNPDAATLQALFKNPPPAGQQQSQPVDLEAEKQKWAEEQQTQQLDSAADSAIKAFGENPANEFFHDVDVMMGKAIESEFVKPNQGENWGDYLKRVYDFACQQHPEVQKVLAGRASQQTTQTTQTQQPAPVQTAKPSLSSGTRNAPPPKNLSRRDAVKWAMKQHGVEV